MGLIFITHDFGIVAKVCDRVAVMYAGKIVEQGSVRDIFNNPSHPYTEALLESVPKMEEDVERLFSIEGQPPPLYNLPVGCSFADRCRYVMDRLPGRGIPSCCRSETGTLPLVGGCRDDARSFG